MPLQEGVRLISAEMQFEAVNRRTLGHGNPPLEDLFQLVEDVSQPSQSSMRAMDRPL